MGDDHVDLIRQVSRNAILDMRQPLLHAWIGEENLIASGIQVILSE